MPGPIKAPWSVTLDLSEVVPGPPAVVWALITDWDHLGDWMLEASDFTVVGERHEGVGVEAEATIRMGGITTRDKVRVTEWEPERRLVIEHLGWVSGTGTMALTPLSDATTKLDWTERFRPPLGIAGFVGMLAFRPLMLRVFRRDLRVLAQLVRARRSDEGGRLPSSGA